jgi:hypothetical protein
MMLGIGYYSAFQAPYKEWTSCLNGGSGLPIPLNEKAHGLHREHFCFLVEVEIVQISVHLKSKNALNQSISFLFYSITSRFS